MRLYVLMGCVVLAIGCGVVVTHVEKPGTGTVEKAASMRVVHPTDDSFERDQARALVAIDRGVNDVTRRIEISSGDPAVLHVGELLDEISRGAGASQQEIAKGICGASDMIDRKQGRRVSRQQITEDLCLAFKRGEVKKTSANYRHSVIDWAMKKYGTS